VAKYRLLAAPSMRAGTMRGTRQNSATTQYATSIVAAARHARYSGHTAVPSGRQKRYAATPSVSRIWATSETMSSRRRSVRSASAPRNGPSRKWGAHSHRIPSAIPPALPVRCRMISGMANREMAVPSLLMPVRTSRLRNWWARRSTSVVPACDGSIRKTSVVSRDARPDRARAAPPKGYHAARDRT
jgi:hypothetical protein